MWAFVWGAAVLAGWILASAAQSGTTLNRIAGLLILIGWLGGAGHSLGIRSQYVERVRGSRRDPVVEAQQRIEQRRRAQQLAAEQPSLAVEIGVGRPDLPEADSMGVVDLNNADPRTIAQLPGIDADLADRIARVREELDGFESLEDLLLVVELDPDCVELVRERVVFLPR